MLLSPASAPNMEHLELFSDDQLRLWIRTYRAVNVPEAERLFLQARQQFNDAGRKYRRSRAMLHAMTTLAEKRRLEL